MTSYWHPFADMGAVEGGGELRIVRGEGAYVWDADGSRYFDATAGLWYCNVGHGRGEISDAAAHQMRQIAAYNNYGDLTTLPTLELADRVAAMAPGLYHMSKLLDQMHGKTRVTTILCYPGSIEGTTGLRFIVQRSDFRV